MRQTPGPEFAIRGWHSMIRRAYVMVPYLTPGPDYVVLICGEDVIGDGQISHADLVALLGDGEELRLGWYEIFGKPPNACASWAGACGNFDPWNFKG